MKRTLHLRKDVLFELTDQELHAVGGGADEDFNTQAKCFVLDTIVAVSFLFSCNVTCSTCLC